MTVTLDKKQIHTFQEKILRWYKVHKRDLPWRQDRDPYHILVSEVMLQQTQVSRVIPKFENWLKAFPTVQSLAKASTREVLLHWSGLGYNRRALYLKKVAEILANGLWQIADGKNGSSRSLSNNKILKQVQNDNIAWPASEKELKKLPGIGEYTARALLCFAFNKQVAVVDTNVRKVILTQFPISNNQYPISNKEVQKIADQLLPKRKAYEWNQALMDYAAARLRQVKIGYGEVKQSQFKDSDRYYRGQIVKYLLVHTKSLEEDIYKLFSQIPTMSRARFKKILNGMLKDNLIQKKGKSIGFLL